MHRTLLIVMLVLAVSSSSSGQGKSVHRPQSLKPDARLFKLLLPQIKRNTDVPVLLPSELPPMWNKYRLYSQSESEANVWKIIVGTEPNCGANVCGVGYLEAKRGDEPPEPDEVDKVVELAKGIKGYYTGESCGGSCTPPQINWVYRGVLYTIQFRVESKSKRTDEAFIIGMANSAIIRGPR